MSFIEDWVSHLRAAGKAERTIEVYRHAREAWLIALSERPHKRHPDRKISRAFVSEH